MNTVRAKKSVCSRVTQKYVQQSSKVKAKLEINIAFTSLPCSLSWTQVLIYFYYASVILVWEPPRRTLDSDHVKTYFYHIQTDVEFIGDLLSRVLVKDKFHGKAQNIFVSNTPNILAFAVPLTNCIQPEQIHGVRIHTSLSNQIK